MNEFHRPERVKQHIAQTFGRASSTYHEQAWLQRECAADLLRWLEPWRDRLPPGPVLELGCGTGFVTEHLLHYFGDRPLEITDLSSEMVNFCRNRFAIASRHLSITYRVWDAESDDAPQATYALMVGGFVFQWFSQPADRLQQLLRAIKPGGILLLSFPESNSFSEWRQMCEQLNLPYTANPLPNLSVLQQHCERNFYTHHISQKVIPTSFPDAVDFFKSLKAMGTGYNTSGKALSTSQMKHLIQCWNERSPGGIIVHHHIAFLLIQQKWNHSLGR